jgi:polyisoprenoid-binding protein YceI
MFYWTKRPIMKTTKFLLIAASALLSISSCKNAPDSDKAETSDAKEVSSSADGDKYHLDASASKIEWVATKVSGYHTGTVSIKSGELTVKDGSITSGNFVIDMPTISVSGPEGSDPASNTKLQNHLHSGDFFDVAKYPESKFEITEIKPWTGNLMDTNNTRQESLNKYKITDPTHQVSGNLTMKDISKNISFPARITVSGNSLEAVAKFNIDRQDWKITYPGKPDDLIRDEIHLGISLKANK